MYAVLSLSGRQYRVTPGARLVIDRLPNEPGETVTLTDRVLLLDTGKEAEVGTPVLDGAEIDIEVLEHFRGPKITVFKMKRRKRYRRKKGFRAELTRVLVREIRWNGESFGAPTVQPREAVESESADTSESPEETAAVETAEA
jgi:large subunit ribosomal protein L21